MAEARRPDETRIRLIRCDATRSQTDGRPADILTQDVVGVPAATDFDDGEYHNDAEQKAHCTGYQLASHGVIVARGV